MNETNRRATTVGRRAAWGAAALLAAACATSSCSSNDDAAAAAGGDAGADAAHTCVETGEHASARAETAAIFDAKRGRVVFFGGDTGVPKQCNPAPVLSGELWTYDVDCKTYAKVDAPDGPGPRTRAAAVYDPEGDRMIVFGGRYRAAASGAYTLYAEVWALDLAAMTWQRLETSGTAPTARSSATAVYAPATKEMIVFGGNTSTNGAQFTPMADVWALELASGTWRSVATSGKAPAARLFHAMTIDAAANRVYVFGGGDANAFTGPFLGDLSSLDLASGAWQTENAGGGAGAPRARINASLAFDPGAGRVVLFGGHDDGDVGNNNDTWTFDPGAKTWTNVVPPEQLKTAPPSFCLFPPDFTVPNTAAPDRRSSHLAVTDAANGRWIVYGGVTDCGLVDDTWSFAFAGGTWTRVDKARTGEACVRGDNAQQCTTLCL